MTKIQSDGGLSSVATVVIACGRIFLLKHAQGMIGVMKCNVSRKTIQKLLPFLLELNNDYTFLRIVYENVRLRFVYELRSN